MKPENSTAHPRKRISPSPLPLPLPLPLPCPLVDITFCDLHRVTHLITGHCFTATGLHLQVHNPCTSRRSHASVALCVHLARYRHGDLVVTRCRHRRVRRDPSARDFAAGDVVKREGRDNQSRSRECTVFFVCIPIHVRRRVVQRMRLLQRTS